MSLASV